MRSDRDTFTLTGRRKKYLLKKAYPKAQEISKYIECVNVIYKKLQSLAAQYNYSLVFEHLGSGARRTYTSKSREIDIFVSGPADVDLANLLYSFSKRLFLNTVLQRKSGGITYVNCKVINAGCVYKLDIVPYAVTQNRHIRDRTYKANQYVSRHITEQLRRTIITDKYLLKKIGLYDSSSESRGFSGYCVQIIGLIYGGLEYLPEDCCTLEDPVDPGRNLLASVSENNLKRFYRLRKQNYCTSIFKSVSTVYEAPMTVREYNSFLKQEYVRAAIRRNNMVYCELDDIKKIIPEEYYSQALSHHGLVYTSGKRIIKVFETSQFIASYNLKPTMEVNALRVYNFFK